MYYESLCPDSKAFIVEQLNATYSKLGEHLDVQFKPFGKATVGAWLHEEG